MRGMGSLKLGGAQLRDTLRQDAVGIVLSNLHASVTADGMSKPCCPKDSRSPEALETLYLPKPHVSTLRPWSHPEALRNWMPCHHWKKLLFRDPGSQVVGRRGRKSKVKRPCAAAYLK